jgi:pantoate--beta-alanine ligase
MHAGKGAARPARLAVGVVSAGRVGSVLGAALASAGHQVVATSAVSRASVRRAERLLPGVPLRSPDEVVTRADLVLLAVPDDVLPSLVTGLARAGCFRTGQIVAHTCGAHGVAVLDPAVEYGTLPLALHPVMTFTGCAEDVQRLATCSVGVTAAEGDEAAWSVGEALVVEMGAEPVRVPEKVRPLYHAALAYGANHLITLVRDSVDVLRRAGIQPAERLIAPLLSAALDNALRHGDRALTGPVARGDVGTLHRHLCELAEHAPEVADSYRALAERTADRAQRAGQLPEHAAQDVRAALKNAAPKNATPMNTAPKRHRGRPMPTTTAAYAPGRLTVHRDQAQLTALSTALRAAGRKVVLVPTMGALHAGHAELIRHARRAPGATVTAVSIFVNPLQFGAGEDLSRYPRTFEADLRMCREEGVELVFAPTVEGMYPAGAQVSVNPGPLGDELEGAVRPGHFAGVLTVVTKLFGMVRPRLAFFGEKDYQQLVLVRRMAGELSMGVEVVGVPTVRAPDGLALSSRNVYLSEDERGRALILSAALLAGRQAGAHGAEAALDAAQRVLAGEPDVGVDYLVLRDPDLGPAPARGPARLLVAAKVGATRLIDNMALTLGTPARKS